MGSTFDRQSKKAIKNSKTISLDKFIFSIGIRHIGQENAKILASFFVSKEEFAKLFNFKMREKILVNLADLDGIGDTQIQSINNFFLNETNNKILRDLIDKLTIRNFTTISKNGKFSNKKDNVYWRLSKYESIRSKGYSRKKHGGKVLGSISKKLDFLIVGNSKPTKKKIDQAKKNKIKIILEKEWNNILNS